MGSLASLFHPSFFGGEVPQKLTISPQTAAKLCTLFFGRDSELQIYHGNFNLMGNEHGKLFVIKRSEGCKVVPKMHQNTLGGRAGPAGGACALSRDDNGSAGQVVNKSEWVTPVDP